eukprot:581582-Heterocapsa_arctica.AAC.1
MPFRESFWHSLLPSSSLASAQRVRSGRSPGLISFFEPSRSSSFADTLPMPKRALTRSLASSAAMLL